MPTLLARLNNSIITLKGVKPTMKVRLKTFESFRHFVLYKRFSLRPYFLDETFMFVSSFF
jgi:hypothetical protein